MPDTIKAPPAVGEVNRFGETWDGSRWNVGSDAPPLGLNLGPRQARGPWDATDTKSMNELLKQFFTVGGATVGGLAAGPAGAIAGGGLGRMIGGTGEQVQELASGRGFSPTAIVNEAPLGAMEGAAQEMLPAAAHGALRFAGRTGRFLGSRLTKNPFTGMTGVPLEVGGELADMAAEKLGPGTTSARLRRRLLTPEAPAAPTTRELLDAGADKYARTKRATALQDTARESASGLAPDLADEGVNVRTRTVRPQAEPGDFPPWREPPPPDTGGGGAAAAPPPQPDPLLDNLRRQTGTGFTPRWSAREGRWSPSAIPLETPAPAAPANWVDDLIARDAGPQFDIEGMANPRPGEAMTPGQTIDTGGQFTMPKNINRDVPTSKSLTGTLRAKTGAAAPSKKVQVLSDDDVAQLLKGSSFDPFIRR